MTPFLSNAHTHSTWCDGQNTIPQMIARAKELGFVSLGFSGHAAQGFDFSYSMSHENQRAYFDELHALQKQNTGLRLWAGLELDAMAAPREREMARCADYWIGSAHYLHSGPSECGVAVDGDPDRLKAYIDDAFAGDSLAAVKRYYEILTGFVVREKPDIIGHFDLVRKYAQRLNLFDENDPCYQKIALDALERAFDSGAVLEVNTGGMARGYLDTPYPALPLLCAWREMGGRVTITSDCHDLRYLDHAFESTQTLLKQAGFERVERLGRAADLWETLPLV